MRTVTINVFKFEELFFSASKRKAKLQVAEAYSSASDYSDVEEDIKARIKCLGFDCELHWTVFGSQGDGACFIGSWAAKDVVVGKTKDDCPSDKFLHGIADRIERISVGLPNAKCNLRHNGRLHRHANTILYSWDNFEEDQGEEEFVNAARDLMLWTYKQLEAHSDWLNSDEYVQGLNYEYLSDGTLWNVREF